MEGERSEPGQYRVVHLFSEGSFLRAYEWSAWMLCRYVHQFKVTRRAFKGVDEAVAFIGFPKTSLAKFMPEGCAVRALDEKHSVAELPMNLPDAEVEALANEFTAWKEGVPLAEPSGKGRPTSASSVPLAETQQPLHFTTLTDAMRAVLAFPLEKRSPIECMLFLAELRGQLASFI